MAQSVARRVTCRYLDRNSNRCTGEVAEEGAEIDLCTTHLAAAFSLLTRRMPALRGAQ